MSQQRADAAVTDFAHVMQFYCVWHIYQIIPWIHWRATVKKFLLARKINPISGYENLSNYSWQYWRQLIAEKMTFWVFKVGLQWIHFTGEVDKSKIANVNFFHMLCAKLVKIRSFLTRTRTNKFCNSFIPYYPNSFEQLYLSASDREKKTKKQYTINTKIQSIRKIIKQSLVCSLQNKL